MWEGGNGKREEERGDAGRVERRAARHTDTRRPKHEANPSKSRGRRVLTGFELQAPAASRQQEKNGEPGVPSTNARSKISQTPSRGSECCTARSRAVLFPA